MPAHNLHGMRKNINAYTEIAYLFCRFVDLYVSVALIYQRQRQRQPSYTGPHNTNSHYPSSFRSPTKNKQERSFQYWATNYISKISFATENLNI